MKASRVAIKLVVSFSMLLGIIVVFGTFGLWRISKTTQAVNREVEHNWREAELARQALHYSSLNSRIILQLFMTTEKADINKLLDERKTNADAITRIFNELSSETDSPEEPPLLAKIAAMRDAYISSYLHALNVLFQDGDREAARREILQSTIPKLLAYHKTWERFVDLQGTQMDDAGKAAEARIRSAQNVAFGLLAMTVLLIVFIALFVSRDMIREISRRQQAEAELHIAHDGMRRAKEEMEVRVKERTAELAESNALLEAEIIVRTNAEDGLKIAMEAAEAANRSKSAFLANMSHEIRTPMSAILGYTELLLEPDQTAGDRLKHINTIRRSGTHLLTVINDILDLSKIESGQMTLEVMACSPGEIVTEIASIMRVKAEEKGLSFSARIDGEMPQIIQTDPTRLRQILMNLIGNAIKFTEMGRVRVNLSLVGPADGPNPQLRFDVTDSGIGLTLEQRGRLFQPFAQADASTSRKFGGTGLGLVISRHLARAMGGDITVESVLGSGSQFTATIPTGPLAGIKMLSRFSDSITRANPEVRNTDESVRLNCRILLAEDGLDNQALISYHLRKAGAVVTIVENGKIACETVEEAMQSGQMEQFDLILMDMQMPELDGYAATARLRTAGFVRPIIALTAHAMAQDREKCLAAGCTDYLTKPIKRGLLLEALQRHWAGATDSKTGGATGSGESGVSETAACRRIESSSPA